MRAQLSLEFLIVMATAVLMLVALLIVGTYQIQEAATVWRQNALVDTTQAIQYELISAQDKQNGYTRTFTLPDELTNKPYAVQLELTNISGVPVASVITVTLDGTPLSIRAPVCNGTLDTGTNTLRKENDSLWCNR